MIATALRGGVLSSIAGTVLLHPTDEKPTTPFSGIIAPPSRVSAVKNSRSQ